MAFRTQKISQMTPKGANLEATDLIEVSTIESGSYVTRSITGQELIDAIPVPPSGITIGTTAITSGTVGRVLFQGTGNVVQQSSSLFWDNTNNRLGIGTSTPAFGLDVVGTARVSGILSTPSGLDLAGWYLYASGTSNATLFGGSSWVFDTVAGGGYRFRTAGNTDRLRIESTGNVLINTTTDAGFRLDVNGTARVQGGLTVANTGNYAISASKGATTGLGSQYFNSGGTLYWGVNDSSGSFLLGTNGLAYSAFFTSTTSALQLGTNQTARLTIFPTTGNVGINTTTDAGFRLDVNGTARVQGDLTLTSTFAVKMNNNNRWVGASQLYAGVQIYAAATGTDVIQMTAGGQVHISSAGGITTQASSIVQIDSTTKGFLPPRMTTTQKNAIATPATGLQVYDTTLNRPCFYDGTTWITL